MEFELDINWRAIRDQKIWLYTAAYDATTHWEREQSWGLLALLDHLQEQAMDTGRATEADVYGF
jgi:hypothetical protein